MQEKPVILFDGVCNLFSKSVQFVLNHEQSETLFFASLQSEYGQNILKQNRIEASKFDSIVLVSKNNIYFKSTAVLKISKHLKFPYNLLVILNVIPTVIRDMFYNIISKYRFSIFGKSETCYIPSNNLKERFIK